jgi:hypothetical protein
MDQHEGRIHPERSEVAVVIVDGGNVDALVQRALAQKHDLQHALFPALTGCACYTKDIHHCVICGKSLEPVREHVDTCGERCFKRLCRMTAESYV